MSRDRFAIRAEINYWIEGNDDSLNDGSDYDGL
jgi:hypothetical protein